MKTILLISAAIAMLPDVLPGQCAVPPSNNESRCHFLTAGEVERALRAAGSGALSDSTENGFRIEVLDQSRSALPEGEADFQFPNTVSAAPNGISVVHGNWHGEREAQQPIWARVRMQVRRTGHVARQDLATGALLTGDSVERRQVWVPFPEASLLDAGAKDGQELEAAGARLKRPVHKGEAIQGSWIEYPVDIHRGQTVELHVRSGAAHLRLQAKAVTNARRGGEVEVRISDRGPAIVAIASGPGQALFEANRGAAIESGRDVNH